VATGALLRQEPHEEKDEEEDDDWSFDGKYTCGGSAPAGAAEIHAIASGRLHGDIEASWRGDRGRANGRRDLGNVLDGSGENGAIENHNGGGDKLVAASGQYETGRQL
jgi:hypothetical protein